MDSSRLDSHSGVSRRCHSIRIDPGSHARRSPSRPAASSPLCQQKTGESRPRGVFSVVSLSTVPMLWQMQDGTLQFCQQSLAYELGMEHLTFVLCHLPARTCAQCPVLTGRTSICHIH